MLCCGVEFKSRPLIKVATSFSAMLEERTVNGQTQDRAVDKSLVIPDGQCGRSVYARGICKKAYIEISKTLRCHTRPLNTLWTMTMDK
jgi:hypothetical protein